MILAVDSSGDELVVVTVGGDGLIAGTTRTGGRHQAHVIDAVEEVAGDGGLGQIEALAVAVGPGSHTGLRVGLSTVAGLAFARRLPVHPLSSLTVAALRAAAPGEVIAMVAAGRGQVHAQAFVRSGEGALIAGRRHLVPLAHLRDEPGLSSRPLAAEPLLLAQSEAAQQGPIASTLTGPEALAEAAIAASRSGHPLDYDGLTGDY